MNTKFPSAPFFPEGALPIATEISLCCSESPNRSVMGLELGESRKELSQAANPIHYGAFVKTPTERDCEESFARPIYLTPTFSWVLRAWQARNRFNGFVYSALHTVETAHVNQRPPALTED